MASGREIKTKIKSVQNIRKVTSALQMVSASKIRKAQDLMSLSRPYARTMRELIGHVAYANVEFRHPFMLERPEVKRVGMVVVSTDRGQCGGLNSNQFRKVLGEIRGWRAKGVEIDMVVIGQKALTYFRRIKDVNLIGSVTHLGERPKIEQLIGVLKVMLDAYASGGVDRVVLSYNDFINTMTQTPRVDALLPLAQVVEELEDLEDAANRRPQASISTKRSYAWDYIYEPESTTVINHLMQRYIESVVYQAVLENLASEQAARMVAMKAASDNATTLIGDLTLIYNKARQASITQEISEIVSGAAAV